MSDAIAEDPNVAAAQARQPQVFAMLGDSAGRTIGELMLAKLSAEAEAAVLRQQLAQAFADRDAAGAQLAAEQAAHAETQGQLEAANQAIAGLQKAAAGAGGQTA